MIIWLASYPRSGNTLLRTILKQTMNLDSYTVEEFKPLIGLSPEVEKVYGHIDRREPFADFYQMAINSEEIFLVKTHRLPTDHSPVIYVIRDGRAALWSYLQYHAQFLSQDTISTVDLILGRDFYGSWSEHYRVWSSSESPRLILRYEDLSENITKETLQSIANFLNIRSPLKDWENPFIELNNKNPNFFRRGSSEWAPPKEWTEKINAIFLYIHGELMFKLGYIPSIQDSQDSLLAEEVALINSSLASLNKHKEYQRICDERMQVIQTLDREVKRLTELLERN